MECIFFKQYRKNTRLQKISEIQIRRKLIFLMVSQYWHSDESLLNKQRQTGGRQAEGSNYISCILISDIVSDNPERRDREKLWLKIQLMFFPQDSLFIVFS